ncbi:phage portal protein, HK97 family [Sphingomonas gellani]|uniref:Phage portal protein, HK97 family n=1 Tax=Sphingomonas gellani TaxID=1166340 RepID=A0A1H7Z778_9SPHN|nr:phage portal protein [Sphingomonas gellani]SEM53844.1 phage portal protein, HK97 family [Sphingomonas gellani]
MGILSKMLSAVGLSGTTEKAGEGPYHLPVTGGWLPAGAPLNWWQTGMDVSSGGRSSMVEACVSAYAQTVAMCPGNHWRFAPDKGRERVATSALARIIRYPNDYQSISDFLLNAVRNLLDDGNAYALVVRNNRFEPTELHLMDPRASAPQLAVDGSVFYHLAGNPIVDRRIGPNIVVPARDVLHLRLHTPRHPLIGESPLTAAALQIAAGDAALRQQVNFFVNQSRPSYILVTDQLLKKEQADQLRELWNEQAKGMNAGGVPILSGGLKPQPIGVSAKDSMLADILKLSDQAIANVYRVPLQILGIGDTPYASTEALMGSWRAGGLGFLFNHIEEDFGLLFNLAGQPDEYLEFDMSALMRPDFKDRVEAWSIGVKGGIFDRNTARADFEQAPVEGGGEPWVQQQDVPLSVAAKLAKEPPAPSAPAVPPQPDPDVDDEAKRAVAAQYGKDLREALNA